MCLLSRYRNNVSFNFSNTNLEIKKFSKKLQALKKRKSSTGRPSQATLEYPTGMIQSPEMQMNQTTKMSSRFGTDQFSPSSI